MQQTIRRSLVPATLVRRRLLPRTKPSVSRWTQPMLDLRAAASCERIRLPFVKRLSGGSPREARKPGCACMGGIQKIRHPHTLMISFSAAETPWAWHSQAVHLAIDSPGAHLGVERPDGRELLRVSTRICCCFARVTKKERQ